MNDPWSATGTADCDELETRDRAHRQGHGAVGMTPHDDHHQRHQRSHAESEQVSHRVAGVVRRVPNPSPHRRAISRWSERKPLSPRERGESRPIPCPASVKYPCPSPTGVLIQPLDTVQSDSLHQHCHVVQRIVSAANGLCGVIAGRPSGPAGVGEVPHAPYRGVAGHPSDEIRGCLRRLAGNAADGPVRAASAVGRRTVAALPLAAAALPAAPLLQRSRRRS